MPQGYKKLNEEDVGPALAKLYAERLDIYYESIVKKKMQEGTLPSYKEFRKSRRFGNDKFIVQQQVVKLTESYNLDNEKVKPNWDG